MNDHQLAAMTVDRWAKDPWLFVRQACRTVDEADEVLRAVALGLWDWQRKTATRG